MPQVKGPTAISKRKMDAQELEWQADSDLRAMLRVEEIKKDPERLARVKALAKKQLEEAAAVVGTTGA